jgi:glycosyltransferase involved in cell wall biosynthesis
MKNQVGSDSRRPLAVIIPGLYGGGCERVMLNLLGGFARRGIRSDLVVADAEGPYLDQVPEGVRLVKLIDRRLPRLRTVATLPLMMKYLRNERPRAVLSAMHANVVVLWARRLSGVPVRTVVSEHNTFTMQISGFGPVYRRVFPVVTRQAYGWADAIVAVSKGAAEDLSRVARLPIARIEVIPNPIITPEMRQKACEVPDHPWFGPGQSPVVLAIGRLSRQKDLPTLIRAFSRVRKRLAVRLLILGEGEDRAELESMVRELGLTGDVGMPGFVRNPYAFLSHSAVLVLSSRWEGLPTVLVEALYCGTPVVSTDCPSGPREILLDGKYGKLVPVGDVEALEEAICASLDGRRVAQPGESWSAYEENVVVDRYLALLLGE